MPISSFFVELLVTLNSGLSPPPEPWPPEGGGGALRVAPTEEEDPIVLGFPTLPDGLFWAGAWGAAGRTPEEGFMRLLVGPPDGRLPPFAAAAEVGRAEAAEEGFCCCCGGFCDCQPPEE